MLTVREAAARAEVSESIVRGWIKDGLAHFRLGAKGKRGRIKIAVEDLDGWLAAFRVEKGGTKPARRALAAALKHLKL